MKKMIFTLFVVSGSVVTYGQAPPAKPQTQASGASQTKVPAKGRDIRERLVQLAMQNPNAEIDDRNVIIADYNLKKAKANILNQVVVQGNLNEFSIEKNQVPNATLYPRYNFGVTIPLGLFTIRSHDIKIARETVGINEAHRSENDKILREVVLAKYEDYLMNVDLLNYQRQLVEDVYSNFQQVEKKFAEGKIQPVEYTLAYRAYNEELADQRRLERDLKVVVIQMDKLIGVSFNDLLTQFK